jgi:hypothetical protein
MSSKLQDFADSQYHRPDAVVDATDVAAIQPSVRSNRNVFIFGMFAFTVGALIILFNSPYRNEFLAPGPLTSPHANLLAGEGADRCAACHDAGRFSLTDWVRDAVSGGSHLTECQSDLCMKCHDKTLPSEFALHSHGMNPSQLASYSKAQTKVKAAGFDSGMIFNAPTNAQGEIACSACHREHHGAQVNLSALSDRQCQSCHQNTFHSFETDHPEFTNWPQVRRDRIAFDHVTHFGKHFPTKSAQFDCAQCHLDDDYQNVKTMAPFEQSCATCHNQQIVDSSQQGMQLLALPMIDVDAIARANLSVGQWPESATGDFDGPLPPITRLLLSSDKNANRYLEQLGADFEFSDIDPDDATQVKAGVELVWHIKELLYELSVSGNEAVKERLSKSAGRRLSAYEIEKLTKGLNVSVFQEAAARWLPNLSIEIPRHREGKRDQSITWLPSESDLFFNVKQDEGELAPNPLKGLLGKSSSDGQTNAPEKAIVRNSQPLPEPSQEPSGSGPANASDKVVNRYLDDENNPDVLSANPLRGLMGQGSGSASTDVPIIEPVPKDPVESVIAPTNSKVVEQALPANRNTDLVEITAPRVLAVTADSGWFRDDLSLSITYRPVGHADQFLTAWTDFAASVPKADQKHQFRPLFEKLTASTTGIGLCSSCHTVDRQSDLSFSANWKAQYRDPSVREFTKFSHGPHLLQQQCIDCHVLDVDTNKTQQFVGFDGGLTKSNFFPITKMGCAKCHAKGQADSSCTICHNYHVGGKVTGPKPLE